MTDPADLSATDLLDAINRLVFLRAMEPWVWMAAFMTAIVTGIRLSGARARSGPAWVLAGALFIVLSNRFVVQQIPPALRDSGAYESAHHVALASFWCAHVPALLVVALALLAFRPTITASHDETGVEPKPANDGRSMGGISPSDQGASVVGRGRLGRRKP